MNSDLNNLEDKIDKARGPDTSAEDAAAEENANNMSNGARAGAELVGCIAGGGLIGFGLDHWLGTNWIFIPMLLLGIVTAFVNVYRTTQNIGTSVGYSELHKAQKDAKNAPEDED
ncbi:MAG: hypothetical protein DHS20C02_05190 [Micavibrio sp.]|nr:MAG: hypothetical protein DHS20C02_05190 [Micavibrio sp.]